MDVYIHFPALPQGMTLNEVESQLTDVLGEDGCVCWGSYEDRLGGRIELELQDEQANVNPKYAQLSVKSYLQQVGFPRQTVIEFGGMEIGLYER